MAKSSIRGITDTIRKYLGTKNVQEEARGKLSAISRRIGRTITDPSELARLARENPLTAAMILYEVYDISHPLLQDLISAQPELEAVLRGFEPVSVVSETKSAADLSEFVDEFRDISAAAASLGGLNRLMAVRRAVTMPAEVFHLYVQAQEMAKVVR